MISARPPESRSTSENSWKARIGSSDGEVRPVMLADAEDVEAGRLRGFRLLQHLLEAGLR
jgi:hypothetical protein